MRIKNKKAFEGGTWMIIVGAIAAIMVMLIVLFIVRGGLSTGGKNVDSLSKCETQGGDCKYPVWDGGKYKSPCSDSESSFYQLGCRSYYYCCVPES